MPSVISKPATSPVATLRKVLSLEEFLTQWETTTTRDLNGREKLTLTKYSKYVDGHVPSGWKKDNKESIDYDYLHFIGSGRTGFVCVCGVVTADVQHQTKGKCIHLPVKEAIERLIAVHQENVTKGYIPGKYNLRQDDTNDKRPLILSTVGYLCISPLLLKLCESNKPDKNNNTRWTATLTFEGKQIDLLTTIGNGSE